MVTIGQPDRVQKHIGINSALECLENAVDKLSSLSLEISGQAEPDRAGIEKEAMQSLESTLSETEQIVRNQTERTLALVSGIRDKLF